MVYKWYARKMYQKGDLGRENIGWYSLKYSKQRKTNNKTPCAYLMLGEPCLESQSTMPGICSLRREVVTIYFCLLSHLLRHNQLIKSQSDSMAEDLLCL